MWLTEQVDTGGLRIPPASPHRCPGSFSREPPTESRRPPTRILSRSGPSPPFVWVEAAPGTAPRNERRESWTINTSRRRLEGRPVPRDRCSRRAHPGTDRTEPNRCSREDGPLPSRWRLLRPGTSVGGQLGEDRKPDRLPRREARTHRGCQSGSEPGSAWRGSPRPERGCEREAGEQRPPRSRWKGVTGVR